MTPPDRSDALALGREAFEVRAWGDACAHLLDADREEDLDPADLERLATAAHLTGRVEDSDAAWARAHNLRLDAGEPVAAARCAFWLGFGLVARGERARGGGWIGRARRLLEDDGRDCPERGYLRLPEGLRSLGEGDFARAREAFDDAHDAGRRFGDPDLEALGRLGKGQVLIRSGRIDEGTTLLDEVMVAVDAGDLTPRVVGLVYCAAVETCQEIFDVHRARAWTDALSRWCEAQPDLVAYRGQCLARRAELMRLGGEWPDALREAARACDLLEGPPGEPAAGLAHYQRGELLRVRGERGEGERAYREAARWGRKPEPGRALLRLAEGDVGAALAAIRRALEEARNDLDRTRLLPAQVEIALAAGEADEARAAADRLAEIAGEIDAPLLHAEAAYARGSVLLDEQNAPDALDALRRAEATWLELDAPYELARTRVLLGLACRALGDEDTAEMELDGARRVFERLGARPDLETLAARTSPDPPPGTHGLTPRQREVLRLVAAGETNRSIASELYISERTVERHVSDIFDRLGVSSRTAAAAYAYEHDLV